MTITFAVLGDSIAFGQGAARTQDTIGARLAETLRAAGTPVELHVFAVKRARSVGLAEQVRQAVAVGSDVALVIIGANDLTHFVPPQQAADQLAVAVRTMRRVGIQVVVTPAPDLSIVPWIPPAMRSLVQAGSGLLRSLQTRAALAEGARVADSDGGASARFAADAALFSADRYHPSSAGYALIAASVAPAVQAAVADALNDAR